MMIHESQIMKIHYITGVAAIFIAIHGFNGLRVILLEFRQNRRWEDGVTIFTIAATIAVIAYGTRTILLASQAPLG